MPLAALSVDMAGNEYESAAVMVANVSAAPLTVNVGVAPQGAQDATAFDKAHVTVRRAVWTMARDGTVVADALPLVCV